ncbi:GGDEF domain-containing protein [Thalassotalea sediminis]|uniref:GGDEF domain-containing protein n=1 Tax=Thalassotalea sediminis TaxID=1759089 RepID=UPI0025732A5B|nr:GGDEF domain-containing protein [Thalassotalea sediminis]
MPHRQYFHRPTVIKDLIIIAVVNFAFLILFMQVDFFEWLYLFVQQNEKYEIDEFIPVTFTLVISWLVFSYRRIKELGIMAHTLEQISLIDPLTGLPNRRSGQLSLISWCELANKHNQAFAVYQIDLDDFKKVNDLYGQIVGDEVLKQVTRKLYTALPQKAVLCRWLDDNFIVIAPLLPETTPYQVAERLQQAIDDKTMTSTVDVTCSIGYAIYEKNHIAEDILHDAEDALLVAKHRGKNAIHGHT